MWNLPGPRTEPTSPALAGRFLTTELPEKSSVDLFSCMLFELISYILHFHSLCFSRNNLPVITQKKKRNRSLLICSFFPFTWKTLSPGGHTAPFLNLCSRVTWAEKLSLTPIGTSTIPPTPCMLCSLSPALSSYPSSLLDMLCVFFFCLLWLDCKFLRSRVTFGFPVESPAAWILYGSQQATKYMFIMKNESVGSQYYL